MTTLAEHQESGALAYWNGVPRSWNPWPTDSVQYQEWHVGHDAARDEVENAKPTDVTTVTDIYRVLGDPVA